MSHESSHHDVSIIAEDGYVLCARFWTPFPGTAKVAVLINAGAGVPARYYYRFAKFLADHGVLVLTYDYRGIGKSRPTALRNFITSFDDWGRLDCAAALKFLDANSDGLPMVVIGHSVGGFILGLAPNSDIVSGLVFIGAHTGYWRDYSKAKRKRMFLLWHLFMPVLTRAVGFFPGKLLRISEDIPAGPALEWASRKQPEFWSNVRTKHGHLDSPRINRAVAQFRAVNCHIVAIRFTDDPFATEAATTRILSLFSNCATTQVVVAPSDIAEKAIGHFGFFKPRYQQKLWTQVLSNVLETQPTMKQRAAGNQTSPN
jgi:predicted alpha/beta hydrolase